MILLAMALAPGFRRTTAQPLLSSRTNVSFVARTLLFFFNKYIIYLVVTIWVFVCDLLLFTRQALSAQASGLGHGRLGPLLACGIFLDQDQTHLLCIGRTILNTGPPGKSGQHCFLCCILLIAMHPVRMGVTPLILHVPSVPWVMAE